MKPNKKAEELIEKFGDLAVDVVEEILRLLDKEGIVYGAVYWQQVKELIINKGESRKK